MLCLVRAEFYVELVLSAVFSLNSVLCLVCFEFRVQFGLSFVYSLG